ncbi:MAG: hypothetical protein ACPG7F_10565 [Aggregatilineales bacterium]
MATSRQVQSVLKKFTNKIKRANDEIEDTLAVIRELEDALQTFNADEDLNVTRGIKGEIKRGKKEVDELRKNVDKLKRELSDTNRKYHHLAT